MKAVVTLDFSAEKRGDQFYTMKIDHSFKRGCIRKIDNLQKIEQCVRKMEFSIPDSEHNGKTPSKCAKFQFIIFQRVLVTFGLGLFYQF